MASSLSVITIETEKLFLNKLPKETARAFLLCVKLPLFSQSGWYLAGGTALALQVGHRQSVDLDFFTPRGKFQELAVERELLATNEWQTNYREQGTIYGVLGGAKISLIAYPFFKPSKRKTRCGTVKILLPEDIAAMKIISISQRGRKRDFVDLYWYCKNREPLLEIIQRAVARYPGQEKNIPHILKSLVYFTDAEADPMPRLFFNVTWKEIKRFFETEVPRITHELIL